MNEILKIVKTASSTKSKLFELSLETKDELLMRIAQGIEINREKIFSANALDLENAKKSLEEGKINKAAYERLKLDENKTRDLIRGIHNIIKLDNPIGRVLMSRELDSNLLLEKVSCPIGLIAVIFEARPDVIIQIASLAIKTGNALILKGGAEAENTNKAFFEIIEKSIKETEAFPDGAINLIFSHEDVKNILELDEYIDLIIPRGSNKLVKYIRENTKIPVLGHASGICHIFVNEDAKKDMVNSIIIDAKTQYPSACNSIETILVHKNYPYISELKTKLQDEEVRVIENPEKFDIEYSDKIVAFKLVNSLDEAIDHINKYGSHHTDAIITENKQAADKFMTMVDSAGVFHNTSTRFSDGFRYGFGAEVGISTNKTLARGPVGIDGLCIYKYCLHGNGQVVGEYAKGIKQFHYKDIFGL